MTTEVKKYELTEEHRAQLKPHADKWIANALSTKQMDDLDRDEMVKALVGLYAAAELKPVKRIIFVSSPFTLRFAAGFAAAIWHLREDNAEAAAKLAALRPTSYEGLSPMEVAVMAATEPEETIQGPYRATTAYVDPANKPALSPPDVWYQYHRDEIVACVKRMLGEYASVGLACAEAAWRMWQGGNQWSAYTSFLSFFRHVAKLDLPIYEKWHHWEQATIHGGPRCVHTEFAMVSDRPEILHVRPDGQPHYEKGPFCQWRDNSRLYALNGVFVPAYVVETPSEQLDPKMIMKETNAEVQRELVRKIGIERVCHSLNAKVIDAERGYELLELEVQNGEKWPYLKMENPSIPELWYVEGVGTECRTVREAFHWRKPDRMREIPVDDVNGEDWWLQGDVPVWPKDAKSLKMYPVALT